jgi:hypothetical protein
MTASAPVSNSDSTQARCHVHPDRFARGTCTRCGAFFCAADRRTVQELHYCASCGERPDINYLELFRQQCWGKRDLWAWSVGYFGLICLIFGPQMLFSYDRTGRQLGWVFIAGGVVGLCFWWGLKYARLALFIAATAALVTFVVVLGNQFLWLGAIPWVSSLFIYLDPRTRLFFREDISEEALRKAWNIHKNNSPARSGFTLSLLGLLFPLVSLFSLVLSLVGLYRVNPNATPPIGRKKQAIAGVILSVLGLAWGAVSLFSYRGLLRM